MTIEQVKNIWENCPKSIEKLIAWYKGQMPKATGVQEIDIPMQEAFKNADKALQVSMAASTPRFLYEFFDENGFFISIGFKGIDTQDSKWKLKIDASHFSMCDFKIRTHISRTDIENEAFFMCFEHLESKLND